MKESVMKKISIILCAYCVLTAVFAAGCGKNTSEKAATAVLTKEAVAKEQDEPLLLGDTNGDGVITIDDATLIQRVLVELELDSDGKIAQRGDVNGDGLSIVDVTLIMRHLAEFDDGYLVDRPTTAPVTATEAVTSAVNEPVTELPPSTEEPEPSDPYDDSNDETYDVPDTIPFTHPPQETKPEKPTGENDLPYDDL